MASAATPTVLPSSHPLPSPISSISGEDSPQVSPTATHTSNHLPCTARLRPSPTGHRGRRPPPLWQTAKPPFPPPLPPIISLISGQLVRRPTTIFKLHDRPFQLPKSDNSPPLPADVARRLPFVLPSPLIHHRRPSELSPSSPQPVKPSRRLSFPCSATPNFHLPSPNPSSPPPLPRPLPLSARRCPPSCGVESPDPTTDPSAALFDTSRDIPPVPLLCAPPVKIPIYAVPSHVGPNVPA